MDNYSEIMAEENSLQGQKKKFMDMYEREIILKKDYSFLVVDKSAKHDRRVWKCEKGKVIYPIRLDGSMWSGSGSGAKEEEKDFIDIWLERS